jgi:hypothetical protein
MRSRSARAVGGQPRRVSQDGSSLASPLTQRRGSKRVPMLHRLGQFRRPSRRGVDRSPNELLGFDGRPSRRGVDRNEAKAMKPGMEDKSPLTQGRGSKRQPDVRNDLRPTNSTSQHGLQARPSDRSGNSDTRRRISSHKNFGIMHLTSYARLASS